MLTPIHKSIILAAQAAGSVNEIFFEKRLGISEKIQIIEYYLETLKLSQQKILNILNKTVPDYSVYVQVGSAQEKEIKKMKKKSDFTVVVESLDGGTNFKLGIPYFSTALTLLKNNQAIFAVVYNSILKITYFAIRGEGAYQDSKKINVKQQDTQLSESVIAYASGYNDDWVFYTKLRKALLEFKVTRVLNDWCSTLDYCLLANGTIDSVINYNDELFDFIGAKLIVHEAGGVITDFSGNDAWQDKSSLFVATASDSLGKKLVKIIDKSL